MKLLLFALLMTVPCVGQGAREYYDEIYKAGGLDRMADGYVCFDDDPSLGTFFILGKSKTLRDFLIDNGGFQKMSKDDQNRLKKDFLIVRGYDKGVAVGAEYFLDADGNSWVGERFGLSKQPKQLGRIRLSVTWETLRYKRVVEVLNSDMTLKSEVARYGKCQEVSAEVRQQGNP